MDCIDRSAEEFRKRWSNPVELFGISLRDLLSPDHDKSFEQANVEDLVDENGVIWVGVTDSSMDLWLTL